MQTVIAHERESDERLALLAGAGDREALAGLYVRWFEPLYDFGARIARDQGLAAEAVEAAFVRAWRRLRRGREPRSVRALLYALVRREALERRRRSDSAPAGGGPPFTVIDEERLTGAQPDGELGALVWNAAATLDLEDYSLLDLHLRQELTAGEIAAALGLDKWALYKRLARLRDSLAASVPEAPPAAAVEVFGALAQVEPPLGAREEVWERIAAAIEHRQNGGPAPWAAAEALVLLRRRVPDLLRRGIPRPAPGGVRRLPRALPTLPRSALPIVAGAAAAGVATAAVLAVIGGEAGVDDPDGVRSVSHEVAVPTRDNVIRMVWRPRSGSTGYSVLFTRRSRELPPARTALSGTASAATSIPLRAGRYWFVLRTRGKDGEWTATVRRGPYVILAPRRKKPRPKKRREEPEPVQQTAPVQPRVYTPPPAQPQPQRPARKKPRKKADPRRQRQQAPEPPAQTQPAPPPEQPPPQPPPEEPPQPPPS